MSGHRPHKEANRLTTIWRDFGPCTYPINIGLIVDEIINPQLRGERLNLIYSSFESFDGLMMRASETEWVAMVNDRIRFFGRRNFTAAHELYHFIAHRTKVSEFSCTRGDVDDYETEVLEVEANQFASQLLLPPDIIRERATDQFAYESVKSVADELGASVTSVAYKWLQLCPRRSKLGFFESRDGFVVRGYASPSAYSAGLYFKSGSELPNRCATIAVQNGRQPGRYDVHSGVWLADHRGQEVVHQTHFEDLTYTFLTLNS